MRGIIVGCGPQGVLGYDRIDKERLKNDVIILTNASIKLLDKYDWNAIWMVSDHKITLLPWFNNYYNKYKHILWGSQQVSERVIVAREWQENSWFTTGDYTFIEGVYRGGGSVVGCALQYCYWNNLDPILCGVDMCGDKSLSHKGSIYKEGHWDWKKNCLNTIIKNYLPQTKTFTPTSLSVERV